MKKIIFLFITLFTFWIWLNNVSANEMKLWSFWSYQDIIPIYWTWWGLYNEQMLFYKFTPNLTIYDSLWNSIFNQSFTSEICWTGYRYFVDLKDFYFIYNCDRSISGGSWYLRPKVFIINKYTRQITTLTNANSTNGNVLSLQFYYKDWIFYFKYNNQFYNFIDNKDTFSWTQIIANPWFTFFTSTYNVLYRYMPTTWFFISSNYKEIFFALNTFSQKDIVLSDKFSNISYSNFVSYDWKTYFSQQSNLWELKTIICDFDNYTNCSVAPDEFISFYNYNSWKWYKLTKTTYDQLNLLWAKYYYWFFDKDTQKYMKWYLKKDWFLYVDISSLWGYFSWSNSWWWETPTPSSPNCYIKDTNVFDFEDTIDLENENINNYRVEYLEWQSDKNSLLYTQMSWWDKQFAIKDIDANSVKYKDIITQEEKTWTWIDFWFNQWTYLELKTAWVLSTYLEFYTSENFNGFEMSCNDTNKKIYLRFPNVAKIPVIYDRDWNIISTDGSFNCWQKIYFDMADNETNSILIKMSWFLKTYNIFWFVFLDNNMTTQQEEICYDPINNTYTKDWEEYEPTDQEKKQISQNINTKQEDLWYIWNKIKTEIADKLDVNEIIWFYNFSLSETPYLTVPVVIPKLSNTFWITTQSQNATLQPITDTLWVNDIPESTTWKNFLVIVLSIIFIISKILLVWLIFLVLFLLNLLIDKISSLIIWNDFKYSSWNVVWIPFYTIFIIGKISLFIAILAFMTDFISIINIVNSILVALFSFFTSTLWNYVLFRAFVNVFFISLWTLVIYYILYKLITKFWRLN